MRIADAFTAIIALERRLDERDESKDYYHEGMIGTYTVREALEKIRAALTKQEEE